MAAFTAAAAAPTTEPAAFYLGDVVHTRHQDTNHSLNYKVFSLLTDVDRLEELNQVSRLFSVNRWNIFSFCERDHMEAGETSIRGFVEKLLIENGLHFQAGRIDLLAYPRFLGHAFNPLSIFYCHDVDGKLRAILYQVRNTFGEWHHYLTEVEQDQVAYDHSCDKNFYVSPFIHMECTYHFKVRKPDESVSVVIRQTDRNGPMLTAAFRGQRQKLTSGTLLWFALRYFQGGFKILAGIHWEALKMWTKGAKLQPRPKPPAHLVTKMSSETVTYGKEVQ
ncbi:DUF1365 domain-containing protein [Pseudovibrio sp. SPO723]|uniref:DUF1365 domain-containing protein n=1 Tax=Nesiotobacter zosterae TaxID=392721 RepID=UPI0029C46FB1|nr:DUF1365 domain-containing protein [Pseudovibrio sp. SPO723]MDX5593236.1 DUF1365 domain-containing protein [Pseudovibrio sp. SPO723]